MWPVVVTTLMAFMAVATRPAVGWSPTIPPPTAPPPTAPPPTTESPPPPPPTSESPRCVDWGGEVIEGLEPGTYVQRGCKSCSCDMSGQGECTFDECGMVPPQCVDSVPGECCRICPDGKGWEAQSIGGGGGGGGGGGV